MSGAEERAERLTDTMLTGPAAPPQLPLALALLLAPALIGACDPEFACSRGSCVPADSVCDFRDDCGDGSDEERCE